MTESNRARELKAQIQRDQEISEALRSREETLVSNISHHGFKPAVERRKLEDEIRIILEADRKKRRSIQSLG